MTWKASFMSHWAEKRFHFLSLLYVQRHGLNLKKKPLMISYHLHDVEPISYTSKVAKNLRLLALSKIYYYYSAERTEIKWDLIVYHCTHRSVPPSTLITEAAPCYGNYWEFIQTQSQKMFREWEALKLSVLSRMSLSNPSPKLRYRCRKILWMNSRKQLL